MTANRHAILVQAHQAVDYWQAFAARMPSVNVYVHVDAKTATNANTAPKDLPNFFVLTDRVAVYWGGFSQIQATLNLFAAALADADNQFLHLVSGEDVVLQDFAAIARDWQACDYAMMLACRVAPQYGYRLISDSPHADTPWQRQLMGKVLTKLQQARAIISPYAASVYFGSQWFSVTRGDWLQILPYIDDYQAFFAKKLVPDEHFFQTLVSEQLAGQVTLGADNRRSIVFDKNFNHGNSPRYLDIAALRAAQAQGLWFARKVRPEVAQAWLTPSSHIKLKEGER